MNLTPDEIKIIKCYRETNDQGKNTLIGLADMLLQLTQIAHLEDWKNKHSKQT